MRLQRLNKLFWILALLTLGAPALRAQNAEEEIPSEIEHAGEEVQVDSTLLGRDIATFSRPCPSAWWCASRPPCAPR